MTNVMLAYRRAQIARERNDVKAWTLAFMLACELAGDGMAMRDALAIAYR